MTRKELVKFLEDNFDEGEEIVLEHNGSGAKNLSDFGIKTVELVHSEAHFEVLVAGEWVPWNDPSRHPVLKGHPFSEIRTVEDRTWTEKTKRILVS